MPKKSTTQELPPPFLKISHEEASKKITAQIEYGSDLLKKTINTEKEVDDFGDDVKRWDEKNQRLLEAIFSNSKERDHYYLHSRIAFSFSYIDGRDLREEYKQDCHQIQVSNRQLMSILDSLEFFEESITQVKLVSDTSDLYKPLSEKSRKVFVVHGKDDGLKNTIARFLGQLDLMPIILHEQANEGQTIIEKFEKHSNGVDFAVVLLTPDDRGGPSNDDSATHKPRARQNVILELGYFLGKLKRKHVVALCEPTIETPSDYDGVLYIPIDGTDTWKFALATEIKAAGIDIDLNKVINP